MQLFMHNVEDGDFSSKCKRNERVGNFRGRKLSRKGEIERFHGENFEDLWPMNRAHENAFSSRLPHPHRFIIHVTLTVRKAIA